MKPITGKTMMKRMFIGFFFWLIYVLMVPVFFYYVFPLFATYNQYLSNTGYTNDGLFQLTEVLGGLAVFGVFWFWSIGVFD